MTKEHLFAKWIRETFPIAPGSSTIEFGRDESVVFSYGGDTLEQSVKAFCSTCNNRWMSQLEVKAGAVLRPMLRAERVGIKMGFADQHRAATWATKTAMVLQQLHPTDSRIPDSDYRDFHRTKQPASSVFVTMGARHIAGGRKGANMFEYKERFIGKDSSGILHVHFAIGALYFGLAYFINRKRRPPIRINEEAAKSTALIWPVQTEVIWPTPSISDIGGVEGMFDAFATALWGYS